MIQSGKHAHLAEFADTGQKHKPQILVQALQHLVKTFQHIPNPPGIIHIPDIVDDGFVIFIHQHHDLAVGRQLGDQIPKLLLIIPHITDNSGSAGDFMNTLLQFDLEIFR